MILVLHQDVKNLVRKYLPAGTVFELHQFYVGWCDAHQVEHKASHLFTMNMSVLFRSNVAIFGYVKPFNH